MKGSSGQQSLVFRTHGGARKGAGRKPGPRPRVSRRPRPPIVPRLPMHLTLRLGVRRLRVGAVNRALKRLLRALQDRAPGFRVLGYSLQDDHLHCMVESDSQEAFDFGVRSLDIRIGLRFNRALARRGRLFEDRYHRRDLPTPREVRAAWAYVLLNRRRHLAKAGRSLGPGGIDPMSSGGWFEGWSRRVWRDPDTPAVSRAVTWLARVGWRRRGLISPHEVPGRRS